MKKSRLTNSPIKIEKRSNEWRPDKPQQNADIERFNRTMRYECLSQYDWNNPDHVQHAVTQWMYFYNHERFNMALSGFIPKQRLAMTASLATSALPLIMSRLPVLHQSRNDNLINLSN